MWHNFRMRKALCFAFVVACGGSVVGPIGDGGGGSDGQTSDGTTGGCTGTPPSCFCGSPKCINGQWGCTDCGNDCNSLLQQINSEQAKLQTCCPTCKSLQCLGTAQGVCCVITINSGDKSNFEALVTKYKQQCKPVCPGIPCPPAPSMVCDPSQMDPNSGHCR